jgi:hypothetical protein
MNKINVFLDDIRMPNMSHNESKGLGTEYSDKNKWIIVRDYFEFIDLVNKRFDDIDLVSFDHDLACYKDGVEYTGKTAADYLIDYCLDHNKKFPNWYAHTDNTSGRQNIRGTILNYLDKVENVDISNVRYFHNGILNGVAV